MRSLYLCQNFRNKNLPRRRSHRREKMWMINIFRLVIKFSCKPVHDRIAFYTPQGARVHFHIFWDFWNVVRIPVFLYQPTKSLCSLINVYFRFIVTAFLCRLVVSRMNCDVRQNPRIIVYTVFPMHTTQGQLISDIEERGKPVLAKVLDMNIHRGRKRWVSLSEDLTSAFSFQFRALWGEQQNRLVEDRCNVDKRKYSQHAPDSLPSPKKTKVGNCWKSREIWFCACGSQTSSFFSSEVTPWHAFSWKGPCGHWKGIMMNPALFGFAYLTKLCSAGEGLA